MTRLPNDPREVLRHHGHLELEKLRKTSPKRYRRPTLGWLMFGVAALGLVLQYDAAGRRAREAKVETARANERRDAALAMADEADARRRLARAELREAKVETARTNERLDVALAMADKADARAERSAEFGSSVLSAVAAILKMRTMMESINVRSRPMLEIAECGRKYRYEILSFDPADTENAAKFVATCKERLEPLAGELAAALEAHNAETPEPPSEES